MALTHRMVACMTNAPRYTPEQATRLVALLRDHFFTRTDIASAFMPWGKPHPVSGGEYLQALLKSHVIGQTGPKAVARLVKRDNSTQVTSGRYRVGTYTPDADGNTRWLCVDFDGSDHSDGLVDPEAAALATRRACAALGVAAHLERSGGGIGWHLWVLFAEPVPATDARRLAQAVVPTGLPLVSGCSADPRANRGIEIFPKQDRIRENGYGNLVWLPLWSEAPAGANQFYRTEEGGSLAPFVPDALETVDLARLDHVVASLSPKNEAAGCQAPAPTASDRAIADPEADGEFLSSVAQDDDEVPADFFQRVPAPGWSAWRKQALAALPLDSVYGPWLTGASKGEHWSECRDPDSPSGDRDPSAGVADGTGEAERGTFHSFRTEKTVRVFDFMVGQGLATSFKDAVRKVAELSGVPLPEKRSSASDPTMCISRPTLPEIRVGRQFREVVDASWAAVLAANDPPVFFLRSGALVRVVEQARQDRTVRSIANVSQMVVYERIARIADWMRKTENGIVPTNPPKDVARVMLEVPHSDLVPLEAVVSSPIFARDGRLLTQPGYHRDAALWLDLPAGYELGDVPLDPTAADVAAARALLLDDLFVDFPFVALSDRAHAVAAVILPFVRRLVAGCTPLHLVEAPTEGTGKGFICHAVGIIATGRECDARTLAPDDNEARKMLTSELSTGRPIILLDNADDRKTLRSPSLASALTAESWTDRLLGTNRMVTMPNAAVWLLTGNNPKLSMELARRCVRIRIQGNEDRPHLRTGFKHDPFLEWVKEHRQELVRAVVTLVLAWMAAGQRRESTHRLGSFERWSFVIGGILEVAGIEGFLDNLEALYEAADVDGDSWRAFVATWWDEYGDTPQTVGELNDACDSHDLMIAVRGDGTTRSQQTRLGNGLMSKRDRVYDGLKVLRMGKGGKDHVTRYALVQVHVGEGDDADGKTIQQVIDFPHAGTSEANGNLENGVPAQGSRHDSPEKPSTSDEAGTCGNLFRSPTHAGAQGGARARTCIRADTHGPTERFPQVPAIEETIDGDGGKQAGTYAGEGSPGPRQGSRLPLAVQAYADEAADPTGPISGALYADGVDSPPTGLAPEMDIADLDAAERVVEQGDRP